MRKPFILSVHPLLVAVRSCICIFNIMCNNQGLSLGIKSKCLILDPLHFSVNSAFLNFLVFLFGDTLETEGKDWN